MIRPTFGVDIDCEKCGTIHPAAALCPSRRGEVTDRMWQRLADGWRMVRVGNAHTSEDLTASIGRPLNDKLIGSVWRRWQRLGWVREERITTARSHTRHGGTLRVWRILK